MSRFTHSLWLLSAALLLASCGETPAASSSAASSAAAPSSQQAESSSAAKESSGAGESSQAPHSSSEEKGSSASSATSEDPASRASSSESSRQSSPDASAESSEEPEESSSEAKETAFFKINAPEHLKIAVEDAKGNALSALPVLTRVYLKVEKADPDYDVLAATATYTFDITTHKDDITAQKATDKEGYFYYDVPYQAKGCTITFAFTERLMTAYKGYPFIGSFYACDMSLFSYRDVTSLDASKPLSINQAGEIAYGEDAHQILSATSATGEGTFQTSDYHTVCYADNALFVGDDFKTDALGCSDVSFFLKKQESGDAVKDYAVYAETFTIESKRYEVLESYRKGEGYATAYVDLGTRKIHWGVTFDFVQGSHVTDATSVFSIKEGETVLATVSYTDVGGAKNRVFASGLFGDFACGDSRLAVLGNGHATYEGQDFTFAEAGEGQYSLVSGARNVIVSIDEAAGTFAVLSDKTTELDALPFLGKTYAGKFYSDWDEAYYYCAISFASEGATFTSAIAYSEASALKFEGSYFNGSESPYVYGTPSAYEFDASSMVLTASVIDCQNKSGKAWKMTYDATKDSWTANVAWSNVFTTKNMVLSAK